MKTIEVDFDRLVDQIAKNCNHYFYNFANGECCYAKVKNNTCDLHAFASTLNCPMDCPRLDTKEYACDKGKCKRVKAIIANLKVQVK